MKPPISRFAARSLPALLAFAPSALAQLVAPEAFLPLGLFDAKHDAPGDPHASTITLLTEGGLAYGTTLQPLTGGEGTWFADLNRGLVRRTGLDDAEHTDSSGANVGANSSLAASGWVAGISTRYVGGSVALGQSAWLADPTNGLSHRVGLSGAGFASTSGTTFSATLGLYATYATGYSNRYSGNATRGHAVWVAPLATPGTTVQVGLYDAEHTRSDDSQFTAQVFGADDLGHVAGSTYRYNGGSASLGISTWAADATTGVTTRIGYFDTAHTFSTPGIFGEAVGLRYSYLVGQGAGGWIGQSALDAAAFGEPNFIGNGTFYSSWFYSPTDGVTRQLGFVTGDYLGENGRRSTRLTTLSADGHVYGYSERYEGAGPRAFEERWVMDLETDTYTLVGLRDEEHAQGDGDLYHNEIGGAGVDGFATTAALSSRFTARGLLLGSTEQWNGATPPLQVVQTGGVDFGSSPWIYDTATGLTTRIGLTDAEHTRVNGVNASQVRHVFTRPSATSISEQGYVGGHANRYAGGTTQLGRSAWIASAATGLTHRVGLHDAEHTRSSGVKSSDLTHLTANGYGAGTSQRYQGGAQQLGQSVWLASGATGETKRVGLFDTTHTSPGTTNNPAGEQYSEVVAINSLGHAAGTSLRYSAAGSNGRSAWIADFESGAVTRAGLFDPVHTSNGGAQFSSVSGLGEAGLAWGTSRRYSGASSVGQTAWIYDVAAATQTDFAFSVRASDGYAFSQIDAINAHGLALGHYTYFDAATSADLGYRPFLWSAELGLIDLHASVVATAGASWSEYLPGQSRLLDSGWVVLAGVPEGFTYGQINYALNFSTVPEPSTSAVLASVGAAAALLLRRRSRHA